MTDLADTLTAHISEPDLGTDEADRWVCDTDQKAAWAARKMAAYQAEVDRITELAADELNRVRAWAEDASHGARAKVQWFESQLVGYAHRVTDAETRTYKIPGADLKARKTPDRVLVDDADEFVAWAVEAGRTDLLNMKPDLTAIKGSLVVAVDGVEGETSSLYDPATSETAPGVIFQVGSTTYTARLR